MAEVIKPCPICSAEFAGRPNKLYCSAKCSQRAAYLNRKTREIYHAGVEKYRTARRAAMTHPTCEHCGESFVRRERVDVRRRFCFDCSPVGDQAASARLSAMHPTSTTFDRKERQRRQNARSARRRAARWQIAKSAAGTMGSSSWSVGPCVECGRSFVDRSGWQGLYCSDRCQKRRIRRDGKARRRARRGRGRVNRRKVFKRDKWTCQICRRKLDRNALVPSPLAPTIDHVVPLASGGEHEDHNAQACCFECNCRKGNGFVDSGEQLRLVG